MTWAGWLHNPCRPGGPGLLKVGRAITRARWWAEWLHNPCRLGGGDPRDGRGYVAHPPTRGPPHIVLPALKSWGPPRRQGLCSRSAYQWATTDFTPCVVAHWWAEWLHNPCRLGGPQRFRAGREIRRAHWWAECLHNPYHLRAPQLFKVGSEIRSAHWWTECLHNPYHLGVLNSSY